VWQLLGLAEVIALRYKHMSASTPSPARTRLDGCFRTKRRFCSTRARPEFWRKKAHGSQASLLGRREIRDYARSCHFFCRAELHAKPLFQFMALWKSYTSEQIQALGPPRSSPAATTLWQRDFFDHVLRSSESYSEKWKYVRDNPVRAGLVSNIDAWKYAGEIETLIL
jgi:hypothetical protein